MAKKLTIKEKKEIELKDKLRTRVRDMAVGAGIEDVDCGDYWCFTADCLGRLMVAISDTFGLQTEGAGCYDGHLSDPSRLCNYDSLNDLVSWLFVCGYRA